MIFGSILHWLGKKRDAILRDVTAGLCAGLMLLGGRHFDTLSRLDGLGVPGSLITGRHIVLFSDQEANRVRELLIRSRSEELFLAIFSIVLFVCVYLVVRRMRDLKRAPSQATPAATETDGRAEHNVLVLRTHPMPRGPFYDPDQG